MHDLNELQAFLVGLIGGVLPEFLALYKIRRDGHLPQWAKTKVYWSLTIAMILVGGGLSYAYVANGQSVNWFLALNIGASAPLILGALTSSAPDVDVGKIG